MGEGVEEIGAGMDSREGVVTYRIVVVFGVKLLIKVLLFNTCSS